PVAVVRLPCHRRIAGALCRVARQKVEPFPGERPAHAAPRQVEDGSRPLSEALSEEREIEQPFAGVVEDFEAKFGVAAGGAADETGWGKAHREINPAQIGRAWRPMRRVGREGRVRVANREWAAI